MSALSLAYQESHVTVTDTSQSLPHIVAGKQPAQIWYEEITSCRPMCRACGACGKGAVAEHADAVGWWANTWHKRSCKWTSDALGLYWNSRRRIKDQYVFQAYCTQSRSASCSCGRNR